MKNKGSKKGPILDPLGPRKVTPRPCCEQLINQNPDLKALIVLFMKFRQMQLKCHHHLLVAICYLILKFWF